MAASTDVADQTGPERHASACAGPSARLSVLVALGVVAVIFQGHLPDPLAQIEWAKTASEHAPATFGVLILGELFRRTYVGARRRVTRWRAITADAVEFMRESRITYDVSRRRGRAHADPKDLISRVERVMPDIDTRIATVQSETNGNV